MSDVGEAEAEAPSDEAARAVVESALDGRSPPRSSQPGAATIHPPAPLPTWPPPGDPVGTHDASRFSPTTQAGRVERRPARTDEEARASGRPRIVGTIAGVTGSARGRLTAWSSARRQTCTARGGITCVLILIKYPRYEVIVHYEYGWVAQWWPKVRNTSIWPTFLMAFSEVWNAAEPLGRPRKREYS